MAGAEGEFRVTGGQAATGAVVVDVETAWVESYGNRVYGGLGHGGFLRLVWTATPYPLGNL